VVEERKEETGLLYREMRVGRGASMDGK